MDFEKALKTEIKKLKAKNEELRQGIINDRNDVVLVPKKIYEKIYDHLEKFEADNKRLRSFLEDALPHIECTNNSQSGLITITAIGEYLKFKK